MKAIVQKQYQPNSKHPNDSEETVWLAQAKNSNTEAFCHIVEKYQQPVYNLCYRMLNNVNDAEDAAQEVLTKAYYKLDTYDDASKFSTWLFSIASHHCIDKLRKRRFNLVSWDDLDPWYHWPLQDTAQPEKVLLEAEAVQEVQTLLNKLPPDYRLVIILKYWYAMSYQEIAQTLETTIGAIKSKLFRARKMMAAKATARNQGNANVLSRMGLTYANQSI
jgi:RNA polymerase sigma-70 factor (ECF subfamily)